MRNATYTIVGGDYEHGGSASKELKELLKKLGADPKAVRRTMVATYEAEMNTVIHANKGVMRVAVDAAQVEVEIEDEGPGIADIGQAMREGFSTAPSRARELGFGAGMGLPNIRRNADRFTIRSIPGKGTTVRFSVQLGCQEPVVQEPIALGVKPERCKECLACLRACPTGAIRVRKAGPHVLEHLCIDCTACIQACAPGALSLRDVSPRPVGSDEAELIVPGSICGQFDSGVSAADIRRAGERLGFERVRLSDDWECALRESVEAYAQRETGLQPVLSPVCPAVVELVRLRFPSLLEHVAPFLTPLESAREETSARRVVFAVLCPSQAAALGEGSLLTNVEVVTPSAILGALANELGGARKGGEEKAGTMKRALPESVVQVSGMRHVLNVLEALENGQLPETPILELYACDQGCFGSPLWSEDAFVARRRCAVGGADGIHEASAIRRLKELKPREGVRLDADMRTAMEKLARIDALTKALPGRNCGVCGAPTCAALAEDIVLGKAEIGACIYHGRERTEEEA